VAKTRKDDKAQYATREDIKKAVEQLSPEDDRRLEKFAQYRIRGLGRRAMGRSHEDLRREAITATWIGAEDPDEGRRWRMADVSFLQHLRGAMRSISSHWKEAADENEAWLESEVTIEAEDGQLLSPLDNAPSKAPDQERVLSAKEQLGAVDLLFQNDDDAALVLEGIKEGWTGPEIMQKFKLPRNRYEAALKRIRYKVK
jgi:hypothetical protein